MIWYSLVSSSFGAHQESVHSVSYGSPQTTRQHPVYTLRVYGGLPEALAVSECISPKEISDMVTRPKSSLTANRLDT